MNIPNIIEISSLQNPLVKLARGLDRKKERCETGLFRAEGARHVKEGLDCGYSLDSILFSKSVTVRQHVQDLLVEASKHGAKLVQVNDKILETISNRDNAQSIIGLFKQKWAQLEDFAQFDLIVALERIKDPGNLGTIIRTTDSTLNKAIVLLEECCDPYSVEAIRAAMGSSFNVFVAKSSIEDLLRFKENNSFKLVGTYLKGSKQHDEIDMRPKTILLMGNEQSGIAPELAQKCDERLRLPMAGRADSLNLAIATGVCLYEIWRQREFAGKL